MKNSFLFLPGLLFFLTHNLPAQDLDVKKLKSEVQHRIDTYLDKEKKLTPFYEVNDYGMMVYASAEKKLKKEPDLKIAWSSLAAASPKTGSDQIRNQALPLEGIRIALDPGHTAGDMDCGKIEQKYLQIPKDSLHHIPQEFDLVEGHLTLGVALTLKKKLENAGAIVMLTHHKPDETACGTTFEEWKKTELNQILDSLVLCKKITAQQRLFYKTKADNRKIFRDIFRDIELQKRADLINAFHPDIAVIIHFNVDEKNTDWKKFTDKDFVMTFIGGGMLPSDLKRPEERIEFLRMATTDDLDKSEKLSGAVVKSFSSVLKVPIASRTQANYLRDNCLSTPTPGVYCRNLILTRIVHTPLVYGETLYQDNRDECRKLMLEDEEIDGVKTSARVREVGEAYYQGILTYFSK
jgi:N-acetylmuramoyl-L-alanine amidase